MICCIDYLKSHKNPKTHRFHCFEDKKSIQYPVRFNRIQALDHRKQSIRLQ